MAGQLLRCLLDYLVAGWQNSLFVCTLTIWHVFRLNDLLTGWLTVPIVNWMFSLTSCFIVVHDCMTGWQTRLLLSTVWNNLAVTLIP